VCVCGCVCVCVCGDVCKARAETIGPIFMKFGT
jgi:hypothetical protein